MTLRKLVRRPSFRNGQISAQQLFLTGTIHPRTFLGEIFTRFRPEPTGPMDEEIARGVFGIIEKFIAAILHWPHPQVRDFRSSHHGRTKGLPVPCPTTTVEGTRSIDCLALLQV